MTSDPYKAGMFNGFKQSLFMKKREVMGCLVVVLDGILEKRGLELIFPSSRSVCKNEIHELILTNESALPGSNVNKIAYYGFFEVEQGGVLIAGDEVIVGGKKIGNLAGFDETHMPNHWNIVINAEEYCSGFVQKAELEAEVKFVHIKE